MLSASEMGVRLFMVADEVGVIMGELLLLLLNWVTSRGRALLLVAAAAMSESGKGVQIK